MAWAKVDDGWWCHPKVMGLSAAARGVWVSVLSWSCQQRSPKVPPHLLAMVGGSKQEANELASVGLWDPDGDGWIIHDWADYQDRSISEKRAEAGRKGGLKSRPSKQTGSKREANPEAGPIPSQPNPTHTSSSQSDSRPAEANAEPDDEEPQQPTDDPPPTGVQARAVAAVELVGDQRHQAAAERGDVRRPDAHRSACRNGARTDHLADAQRLAHEHPDWTVVRIADRLTRASVPVDESRHPAVVAQRRTADADPPPPAATPAAAHAAADQARAAIAETLRARVSDSTPGLALVRPDTRSRPAHGDTDGNPGELHACDSTENVRGGE